MSIDTVDLEALAGVAQALATLRQTPDPLGTLTGDPLFTVGEVAQALRCSEQFVYTETTRGNMGFVAIGNRKAISLQDVTQYIARHRVAPVWEGKA